MTICVIMQNMIIEDEHPNEIYDQEFQFQGENVVLEHGRAATFAQFIQFLKKYVLEKLTFNQKMI